MLFFIVLIVKAIVLKDAGKHYDAELNRIINARKHF